MVSGKLGVCIYYIYIYRLEGMSLGMSRKRRATAGGTWFVQFGAFVYSSRSLPEEWRGGLVAKCASAATMDAKYPGFVLCLVRKGVQRRGVQSIWNFLLVFGSTL